MTFFNRINAFGERVFGSLSIEGDVWLQAIFYTLLVHSILVFNSWRDFGVFTKSLVENHSYTCWPYFLSCHNFYVFNEMPNGYSLGLLYAFLGLTVVLAGVFAVQKKWGVACILLALLTFFKFFVVYIVSFNVPTNYNTLAIIISIALLFPREKVFSIKVLITLFYYVTVIYRIHPGYLSGDVFTSLAHGLPLIPNIFTPYIGVLFIIVLILAPTAFWMRNDSMRIAGFATLLFFHTTTIAIVGFIYPLLSFSLLFFAFYAQSEQFILKRIFSYRPLLFVSLIMIIGQLFPFIITGDHRLTGEGTKLGFYMYEANHQCSGYLETIKMNGASDLIPYSNGKAMGLCDPYLLWFDAQTLCKDEHVARVGMVFDHSINGHPYIRLVDEKNICDQDYSFLSHNTWINIDGEQTPSKVNPNTFFITAP
jgi:hypothetical protein